VKNFAFQIQENILTITIDLSQEHGPSRSGHSQIVSSTEGNVLLFDQQGFREEIINCNVTRKIPKEQRGY
jgi:hypothetical protein